MVEAEYMFFQRMRERIDQRIREGNYDEAAVNMQKCMEYIANSLDCKNHNYRAESLWDVIALIKSKYPEYPLSRHEWGRIMSYCCHQLHLQEEEIDYRLLREETKIVRQLLEKIIAEYLNRQDLARWDTTAKDTSNDIKKPISKPISEPNDAKKKKNLWGEIKPPKKSILNSEEILKSETMDGTDGIWNFENESTSDTTLKQETSKKNCKESKAEDDDTFRRAIETMI